MPWRVGVLGSEDGANAEDTLPASCNLELLVELGRLGEESLLAEIGEPEDIASTLRRGTDEAGGLELLECERFEVGPEELLDFNTDILHGIDEYPDHTV